MLKLKLQYFDHLMQKTDSFEKALAGTEHTLSGFVGPLAVCIVPKRVLP